MLSTRELVMLGAIITTVSGRDDLLKPRYRRRPRRHALAGHCAVATEALYFLLGGPGSGWVPHVMRLPNGDTHWFLRKGTDGRVLDLTSAQFPEEPDYSKARPCGFSTPRQGLPKPPPSRRAQVIIDRVNEMLSKV